MAHSCKSLPRSASPNREERAMAKLSTDDEMLLNRLCPTVHVYGMSHACLPAKYRESTSYKWVQEEGRLTYRYLLIILTTKETPLDRLKYFSSQRWYYFRYQSDNIKDIIRHLLYSTGLFSMEVMMAKMTQMKVREEPCFKGLIGSF